MGHARLSRVPPRPPVPRPPLTTRSFLGHAARGFVIGSADLVPGVSGGTMALILGIYRRLVHAIGAFTQRGFRTNLVRGRVRAALEDVDAGFLAALAVGIGTALVLLANVLEHLLTAYQPQVYAAFFGLIAGSVVLVARRVERWGAGEGTAFAAGALGAFLLVGLSPTTTPQTAVFLAASGALAVCALILPGISGAFILVLLGKYRFVLEQLAGGNLVALLPVIGGGVVGLLAFSRVLAWLLDRHGSITLAVLSGFLLGSLRKVWPWQETLGALMVNVAPPGAGPMLVAAGIAVAGAALVFLMDRRGDAS